KSVLDVVTAVQAIEERGGHVSLDPEGLGLYVSLFGEKFTDTDLKELKKELKKLKFLRTLDLRSSAITDEGLKELKEVKSLHTLTLGWGITDAGVKELKELKSLQTLIISQCRGNDGWLRDITELTNLQVLDFEAEGVTEAGIRELKNLNKL